MIGLSTYAYFWQCSEKSPAPMSLEAMLRDARSLGAEVFQICDFRAIESYDQGRLEALRGLAAELGLTLELGTRGVRRDHLARYLAIAQAVDSAFVRSMVQPADTPLEQVAPELSAAAAEFSSAGVRLGLETYEQVPTKALVDVVSAIDRQALGIVLDPANSVAALEHPRDVVSHTAPWVNNLHIKDFAFSRQPGWVGFVYSGVRLGEGLLDYDAMIDTVAPAERGVNQIIEHWLPWQGDIHQTIEAERDWTTHSINYLRSRQT